jgi:raffinose/stachyose/melibiose transport system substrate-binding protein
MQVTLRTLAAITLIVFIVTACAPGASTPQVAAPTESTESTAVTEEMEAPATEAAATSEAVPAEEPITLVMWWWGEQEAPGAQTWLDETVALYQKAHPGVTVETVLQSTDTLLPAFQSAIAAQEGPDIQYVWGGMYTMEYVWGGGIAPVDGLIPEDELAHYILIDDVERNYDGQVWSVPFYMVDNVVVYNPSLFDKAGISQPPETWDELLDACGKLNDIGVIPMSGGLKDAWWGGWLFTLMARQPWDSPQAIMRTVVGEGVGKFSDPEYTLWWSKLQETIDAGCWNEDVLSLDYQQGMDRFARQEAAMVFGNATFLAGWADTMGWDNLGVMQMPKFADGALADTHAMSAQGLVITSWSPYKQEAADFLMFIHTPERVNAWYQATGVLPADDRFDAALIEHEPIRQLFEWYTTIPGPLMEDFIPSMMDAEANMTGAQYLFGGDKTPAELGQLADEVCAKWRDQNPEAVQNFLKWTE